MGDILGFMAPYTKKARIERFNKLYDNFRKRVIWRDFGGKFHELDSKLNELLYSERIEEIFTEEKLLKLKEEYEIMQGEIEPRNNRRNNINEKV